jgi:hypothetical protein
MNRPFVLLLTGALLAGCAGQNQSRVQSPESKESKVSASPAYAPAPQATQSKVQSPAAKPVDSGGAYVFGWGFQPSTIAKPRGGTTTGGAIRLASPTVRQSKPDESAFDRDRAAILAMAGDFRTSFHFMETLGVLSNYTNTRPYYSWATEHVRVLEDKGEFISLQHTLVMFFADEKGSESKPMLTKHWRQDWTYQDTDLHQFKGNSTWAREKRSPESVKGAWSQAVFHVDDEPRYEVVGRWEHSGDISRWLSETDWRPLPRREFSVRSDYDVLEGRHQIVITPTGWVHEQDNWKRVAGDSSDKPQFLAQEWGINRYECIELPSLVAADEYWKKTGTYWAAVRQVWRDVFAKHDRFSIKSSLEGQQLFELHFAFAEEMANGRKRTPEECLKHARDSIRYYLVTPEEGAAK